jgi:hypothetical protein
MPDVRALIRAASTLLVLATLAGCASTEVTSRQAYGGPALARPDRIIVEDLGATPSDFAASSALAAEAAAAAPQTAEDVELGRRLGAEAAEQLTANLQEMGLPAVQATGQPPPRPGDIVIKGNFYTFEEGSTGRRVLVGLGSGAAELRTVVEVYQMTSGGLRHLAGGTTGSEGGKTPGIAAPLAVFAATANPIGLVVVGAMKVRGERTGSNTIEGAAKRTADEIATRLEEGARKQRWI